MSHNLEAKLWGRLAQAPSRWEIHREVSLVSLSCVEATLECRDTRQRTYDELAESDLEGLLCKTLEHSDGWASKWCPLSPFGASAHMLSGNRKGKVLSGGRGQRKRMNGVNNVPL